jgi:hypothetical protein
VGPGAAGCVSQRGAGAAHLLYRASSRIAFLFVEISIGSVKARAVARRRTQLLLVIAVARSRAGNCRAGIGRRRPSHPTDHDQEKNDEHPPQPRRERDCKALVKL